MAGGLRDRTELARRTARRARRTGGRRRARWTHSVCVPRARVTLLDDGALDATLRPRVGAHSSPETTMFIIREIMYCKPGKVRPLVDKFKVISELSVKMGMPKMRIMTDFCAERYWTIVSEIEVADLNAFEQMMASMPQGSTEDMKRMEEAMQGYHDLVDHGKREIYRLEA
jgi:hypothetical protein